MLALAVMKCCRQLRYQGLANAHLMSNMASIDMSSAVEHSLVLCQDVWVIVGLI